ncbi:MAG: MarR family transcriptional regulator [Anaerolineales bacterium]|nr:MarR family transcriptional regulator [Anaerolineales bacterium]
MTHILFSSDTPLPVSETVQDYLLLIYVMERDGEPVIGARLAELLNVTPPTVTNTLKRMARDGLLTLSQGATSYSNRLGGSTRGHASAYVDGMADARNLALVQTTCRSAPPRTRHFLID